MDFGRLFGFWLTFWNFWIFGCGFFKVLAHEKVQVSQLICTILYIIVADGGPFKGLLAYYICSCRPL